MSCVQPSLVQLVILFTVRAPAALVRWPQLKSKAPFGTDQPHKLHTQPMGWTASSPIEPSPNTQNLVSSSVTAKHARWRSQSMFYCLYEPNYRRTYPTHGLPYAKPTNQRDLYSGLSHR